MPYISLMADRVGVANRSINKTYADPTNVAARKESITKATEHPISNTAAAAAVADTTNESANSEAVTKALAEVI